MVAEPHSLRERCARCGHAWSFHGKREHVACRAMGCKGDHGERCPGFIHQTPAALSAPA